MTKSKSHRPTKTTTLRANKALAKSTSVNGEHIMLNWDDPLSKTTPTATTATVPPSAETEASYQQKHKLSHNR